MGRWHRSTDLIGEPFRCPPVLRAAGVACTCTARTPRDVAPRGADGFLLVARSIHERAAAQPGQSSRQLQVTLGGQELEVVNEACSTGWARRWPPRARPCLGGGCGVGGSPRRGCRPACATASLPRSPVTGATPTIRILLADDENSSARALAALLLWSRTSTAWRRRPPSRKAPRVARAHTPAVAILAPDADRDGISVAAELATVFWLRGDDRDGHGPPVTSTRAWSRRPGFLPSTGPRRPQRSSGRGPPGRRYVDPELAAEPHPGTSRLTPGGDVWNSRAAGATVEGSPPGPPPPGNGPQPPLGGRSEARGPDRHGAGTRTSTCWI